MVAQDLVGRGVRAERPAHRDDRMLHCSHPMRAAAENFIRVFFLGHPVCAAHSLLHPPTPHHLQDQGGQHARRGQLLCDPAARHWGDHLLFLILFIFSHLFQFLRSPPGCCLRASCTQLPTACPPLPPFSPQVKLKIACLAGNL